MNKIFVVVGILVILFGSKIYVENRYEKALNQAILLIQPFVSAKYGNLNIEFDGSLSISDIELNSASINSPVSIKDINISSSDRLFLFRGKDVYTRGELPDSFSVTVEAFEFDTGLIPIDDQKNECKRIEAGVDYSKLGESSVSNDIAINLDFKDTSNGLLNLTSTNKFSTTEAQISFKIDDLRLNNQASREIPINTFSLSDTMDQAHAEDVIRYCAKKLNLSNEQFIDTVIGSTNFTQGLIGVDLGNDFKHALKQYYRGNRTLKVYTKPSKQLKNLNRARLFKSKDIVKMLNLKAQLDEKVVPIEISEIIPVEGQLEKPEEITQKITPTINSNNNDLDPRIVERMRYEEEKKKRKPASYRSIKLSQANRYKNYDARVKRYNKTDVSGILMNYDPEKGKLVIAVARYGGNALFTLDKSEVRLLEVYH